MTAPDLVRQILAAIEEAEREAGDAKQDRSGTWTHVVTPGGDNKVVDDLGDSVSGHYDVASEPWWTGPHIARHDPASVLRRCAADRRRLERHYVIPDTWGNLTCGYDRDGDDETIWPCPDMVDLADSYALAEVVMKGRAARAAEEAKVHREEDWFIAQASAPDVASQGRTEAEARANLREAVELHLTSGKDS